MDALKRLQDWYRLQCDGEWEHRYGVEVGTLDNPGWRLQFDLVGTAVESRHFAQFKVDRSESDWIHAKVEDGKFVAACGPSNLEEALKLFLDWAESK